LENGANVDGGGRRGTFNSPLVHAIQQNNIDVVRLLLENGADPNLRLQHHQRSADDDDEAVDNAESQRRRGTSSSNTALTSCRPIDIAIRSGQSEMLPLLLQYGALIGYHDNAAAKNRHSPITTRTSLNHLLRNDDQRRENKVAICLLLLAKDAVNTVESNSISNLSSRFLSQSLRYEIDSRNFANVELLVEAGVEPTVHTWNVAIRANQQALCRRLMVLSAAANGGGGGGGGAGCGIDPFQEYVQGYDDFDDENVDDFGAHTGISPFHTAARQVDTTIFKYFLIAWDERFATSTSTSAGKNEKGEYPIHAICRDAQVSLEAVQLLLAVEQQKHHHRHHDQQRPAPLMPLLASLQKLNGLYFAFEIAAMSNASIDVIYTLLQQSAHAVLCEH
jgi:Ankyrin repeat